MYEDKQIITKAAEAGVSAYLLKTSNFDSLLRAICSAVIPDTH